MQELSLMILFSAFTKPNEKGTRVKMQLEFPVFCTNIKSDHNILQKHNITDLYMEKME